MHYSVSSGLRVGTAAAKQRGSRAYPATTLRHAALIAVTTAGFQHQVQVGLNITATCLSLLTGDLRTAAAVLRQGAVDHPVVGAEDPLMVPHLPSHVASTVGSTGGASRAHTKTRDKMRCQD